MDKTKYFAAAEKAVLKGQNEKALEALEVILKADANDLKALNRAADIYLKVNNNEKALEYLKRVGAVYTRDGFYSKAVAIYKRILKVDQASPKHALIEIHERLADLYGQLGLVSDAMSHFSIVVDFYDQTANQESLLKVLKKVSDLDPFNIESQLKLASLFLAEKKNEEAIETLKRLEENINSRGHLPDIVRVQERWVEFFPQDISRLQALVDLYLRANEPKKALARIQLAFKSDPKNAEVLELLSATFLSMKQPDKAKAVDTELLKIYRQAGEAEKAFAVETRLKNKYNPVAPEIPAQTAQTNTAATKKMSPQAGVGKGDELLDDAESLIKELPLEADERKVLSECEVYLKYGLAEKAIEVLKNNLGRFPKSIALRWKLKSASDELGRAEEAKHLLSEIVMLSTTLKLDSWNKLASNELSALDPEHPSLQSTAAAAKPKAEAAPKQKAVLEPVKPAQDPIKDFDSSEISIVVDDEFSIVNDVSDISLKDLQPEVPVEPEAVEEPAVQEESAPLELELEEESSGGAEDLLSDADFTSDELNILNNQLAPEEPKKMSTPEPVSEPEPLELNPEPSLEVAADDDFEIRQGLEEVEFFKAQGLKEEATALLKSLKEKFPNYKDWNAAAAFITPTRVSGAKKSNANEVSQAAEKVKQKKLEIETLGTKVKMTVQNDERSDSDADFYDLAVELDQELQAATEAASTAPAEVKDVFNAFKKGVAESVSEDDWQTHFDLGVAYREMGLLDDAIEEFKLVGKAKTQKVSALYQMGVTEMARANYKKAKEYFDEALKSPQIIDQEKLSLTFELAEALLHLNDKDKAKKLLQEVQKLDPEFREVTERIRQIG